jgi:hypothetical protein
VASSKSFTTRIHMGASSFEVTHLEPRAGAPMIHVGASRLSDRDLSSVAAIISELHGITGCPGPWPSRPRQQQHRQPRRAPPHVRLTPPPAFVPDLREVTL